LWVQVSGVGVVRATIKNDMRIKNLQKIAKEMLTPSKGILAADESNSTAAKRLSGINVKDTEENRRIYRELFIDTPGIGEYLSGIILYDETIRQADRAGRPFVETLIKE